MELEMAEQPGVMEQNTEYSLKLQETLELDGSPVALAIIPEKPALPSLKNLRRKITACMMLQIARRGAAFYSSPDGILCGARAHLGMGKHPIRKLDDFLVRRERLFGSKAAACKLINSALNCAPDMGEYLALSPLETADFIPDVVLFVGTPLQISRILFLDAFETGDVDVAHGEPLCSGVIALPVTTGRIGISFLDMSCRVFGRYQPEEMVIGVPYAKIPRIVDSIDLSIAGTARPDIFLRLAGAMLQRCVPDGSG
jgi:uncharacterized protein (DUF169 family)